jgi:hypothetical protein
MFTNFVRVPKDGHVSKHVTYPEQQPRIFSEDLFIFSSFAVPQHACPISGLPDFSRYYIPKRKKIPQIVPNGHNLHLAVNRQNGTKNTKIFHFKTSQNLPKLDFWFENIPSGNTGQMIFNFVHRVWNDDKIPN